MKRFAEKETREALANGATIRAWDRYTANAKYRVIINDETEGYIISDLVSKLLCDGTIAKTHYSFYYTDYAAAQPAQDAVTETETENQTDGENAAESTQNENNEIRTREQIIDDIIDFFNDNDDALAECIEDLDTYNEYLGGDRYYDMEMLDEFYAGADPTEILRRAFYGHDAECWHTDSRGEKEYGEFNPNRDYFRYNGYGNLISCDYKDYSDHNDTYFVIELIKNRNNVESVDNYNDLAELLDEYENADET